MGHSLLFAVGAWPPHDGVRRAWRPNLFHGVGDIVAAVETLSGIAAPIVPMGTISAARSEARLSFSWSSPSGWTSGGGCGRRLAEAEVGIVAPHPVQDDAEFARHRDPGAGHAAAASHLHAPDTQARPFRAAHEQGVRRLVKRGARELVAATADPALDVGLTRLVARRRQAEMSAPRRGTPRSGPDRPRWHGKRAP